LLQINFSDGATQMSRSGRSYRLYRLLPDLPHGGITSLIGRHGVWVTIGTGSLAGCGKNWSQHSLLFISALSRCFDGLILGV
jgi:hypothetical protein